MKTQPFEPPALSGKDRVKIIVKPGHWTSRAKEGKLFHLLTAHPGVANATAAVSPTVKIEVRRAPKAAPPLSPTHGAPAVTRRNRSTTSSRSAATGAEEEEERERGGEVERGEVARRHPAVLEPSAVGGRAEPATATAPANHAGLRHPASSFRDPVLDQACDPMMSGTGSVFCEAEELTPGGATVYKGLVSPGDEDDLTSRIVVVGGGGGIGGVGESTGGGGGGQFRGEELAASSGGPASSEASSVMDYEAFDMPMVGDLDLLESMLTTAACQSGREGEENSSGGSLLLLSSCVVLLLSGFWVGLGWFVRAAVVIELGAAYRIAQ